MKSGKSNVFKRLWLLLLSVGPGIFCIGYTIGTGSVTSMIKSGSQYGLQLLWVLFLSAFFAWILMESFGRYAAVTGNTAVQSFRTKLKWGKLWAVLTIVGVVLGQWSSLSGILGLTSNAIYEVSRLFFPGLKESNYWAVLGIAITLIILMYALLLVGKYSFFEKILVIFVTIMGFSFILSMFMVLPSPVEIARGFIPAIPPGGNLMVAAFVGTTMAAPTFIVRPLIVKEKGWNKNHLKEQRKDALISAILLFFISATIMIAATGALFHNGKAVTRVLDMVYALEPVAGKFAVALFMFGAMSAGLSSIFPILMILPLLIGDYKQGLMDTYELSEIQAQVRGPGVRFIPFDNSGCPWRPQNVTGYILFSGKFQVPVRVKFRSLFVNAVDRFPADQFFGRAFLDAQNQNDQRARADRHPDRFCNEADLLHLRNYEAQGLCGPCGCENDIV